MGHDMRAWRYFGGSGAAVAFGVVAGGAAPAYSQSLVKIGAADAFLESIGVDGDANATTAAQLAYLGVRHLRTTGISTSADLLAAGAGGARIDVITPTYFGNEAAVTTATLRTLLSTVIDPAASVIESIEGPNEVNTDPDTFNGLPAGPASMEAMQQCLYRLVRADPNLTDVNAPVAVYDFSVAMGADPDNYSGMQSAATNNNVHAYGEPGVQPSVFLVWAMQQVTIAGTDPYVLTETGAETMRDSGVDEPTQAAYEIDALLDSAQAGYTRTYLFDIQDFEPARDMTDFSGHYGLYKYSGAKKLAARALHNFTRILSARRGRSRKFVTLPVDMPFTVAGQYEYYTNAEYLQKPTGYSVVLWNETYDWNPVTHRPVAIPSNSFTLTLGAAAAEVAVYDPLISDKPLSTAYKTATVPVTLNTHPLVVDVVY